MKTKYSIYISLLFLTILFSFTSCVKDELDTWVSIEASKTEVAVNETVTFTVSGNAETYVVYSGDAGHDFAKSYLVITEGKKIDQEVYVLSQEKLDEWTPILKADIIAFNLLNPNAPVDENAILAGLQGLVGKPYYKDTAANRLREIMPTLKTYLECGDLVTKYFTNNSVLLAPVGGFSTGVALDRNNLTYSYKFATPGTYVVTLLGTKLSDKNYSGSGYMDDRSSSAGEYDYKRNMDTVTIVVQ